MTYAPFFCRLSGLIFKSSLTMISNQFPLVDQADTKKSSSTSQAAQISLSMALRYIHRPAVAGYGAHRDLQDLKKIIPRLVFSKA